MHLSRPPSTGYVMKELLGPKEMSDSFQHLSRAQLCKFLALKDLQSAQSSPQIQFKVLYRFVLVRAVQC